jgi:hypothetical protein
MFEKRKAAKELVVKTDELRAFVESLIEDDGTLPEGAEHRLAVYMREHCIAPDGLPQDARDTMRLAMAASGEFAQIATTLLLKSGEVALEETPAGLLKEVTEREFQGGSRGFSVPLGHGVRYRAGAVRGHMVTIGTEWQVADTGLLTVTDQRVVYHGGRKTLEFLFAKLATLNAYSDAIDLGVTNRQTTSSFRVANPEVVSGIIRAAVALNRAGQEPMILLPPGTEAGPALE